MIILPRNDITRDHFGEPLAQALPNGPRHRPLRRQPIGLRKHVSLAGIGPVFSPT